MLKRYIVFISIGPDDTSYGWGSALKQSDHKTAVAFETEADAIAAAIQFRNSVDSHYRDDYVEFQVVDLHTGQVVIEQEFNA